MILRFDSIAAIVRDYQTFSANATAMGLGTDTSWFNGETREQSIALALSGDTRLVPEAEKLLDQLDTGIETPRKIWEPNVAGAFASVPDFLSGRPTSMRRQVQVHDEHQPITILVDLGSSTATKIETMRKRGISALALTLALARIRPVSLWVVDCGNGKHEGETIVAAPINTTPLDLATACYVLTSAGFARRICYGLEQARNQFSGGWPKGYNASNPQHYYHRRVLPSLGFDPKYTLIIPAAHINSPLVTKPMEFIQDQIKHFVHMTEEAALT